MVSGCGAIRINITSAKYFKNSEALEAIIDGETMCIPTVTDNRHYQAILEWVDEGNAISEAES